MTAQVRTERIGAVLHVQLHRPARRNAISRGLMTELGDVLMSDEAQAAVAVVLTGAGGAFSAGADLGEITGTAADAGFDEKWAAVTAAVRTLPRPVVAAVEGPCRGAAVDLALACDVRVAADGATFGVPAVHLGLLYRPESVARMHRTVGAAGIRRLLLVGDTVDAATARELGLVHEVVSDGQALDHAVGLVAGLPPEAADALAATKGLLNDLDDAPDVGSWGHTYAALLRSPARATLSAAARERHGRRTPPSDPSEEQK